MIWLILGLVLWTGAHLFKRVAPDVRAGFGETRKLYATIAIVASIVLMVVGYRMVDGPYWWGRSSATVGINNLLMLGSVYLFASSGMKTWITTKIRHPQLTAMKLWAISHLLVNGDLPSLVLFGGLLAWAVVKVIIINKADGRAWSNDVVVTNRREIMAGVAAVVATLGIMVLHNWLGAVPWG